MEHKSWIARVVEFLELPIVAMKAFGIIVAAVLVISVVYLTE